MSQKLELEDEEFEQLLLDKRHKELLSAINRLLLVVQQDTGMVRELHNQSKAIQEFKEAIQTLKQPDVIVNQEPVLTSIKNLSTEFKSGIAEVKKLLSEEKEEERGWSFDIVRDFAGSIVKVNAKQNN